MKRVDERNSKEVTTMLSKYILEFSIWVPNKPAAWQQALAQKDRQKKCKTSYEQLKW